MKISKSVKKRLIAGLLSFTLITSTATITYAKMFGKSFNSSNDYSCCVGDNLYIFHYYETKFLWVTTGSGYESEMIGSSSPGNCGIQCPHENNID